MTIETPLFETRPYIGAVPVVNVVRSARQNKLRELTSRYALNKVAITAALDYYEQHKAEIEAQEAEYQAQLEEIYLLYG